MGGRWVVRACCRGITSLLAASTASRSGATPIASAAVGFADPGAVDIAHVEVSQFGDPGSGGIHRGQHGAVAEVSGRFQQRFDFLRAQDDRQLLFVPGQGNAFDGDLPVQRVGVEKPESRDDLDVVGQGRALLLAQKQLVLPNVLGGRVGLAASQNAWRIRQRREGWQRWLWVRSCESGDPPASAVVMWSPRNSPFVVHHITNGRRTEGEQAARPEETLRYPGDQTRTTTDARRSDAGRLSSTSFMLHYLPTPRERCDGCHFANYPA